MGLSSKDYKNILDTIDIVYSVPDRRAMFCALFERLEKWIGISSGVVLPLDAGRGRFQPAGAVGFHIDDGAMRAFFDHFAAVHPLVQKGLHRTTMNRSLRLTDHVPPSRLPETEWGRDFQPTVPIFYEMSANFGCRGAPLAGLALHRKKRDRDFSGREVAILDTVLPHLGRAMQHLGLLEARALPHGQIRAKLTGLGLTPREQEISVLVIAGSSNREIAARLFLSELTVKDHLKNVFGKLAVRRRSELTARILGIAQ